MWLLRGAREYLFVVLISTVWNEAGCSLGRILLALLLEEGIVHVGQDASGGNRDATEVLVQLLVVLHGARRKRKTGERSLSKRFASDSGSERGDDTDEEPVTDRDAHRHHGDRNDAQHDDVEAGHPTDSADEADESEG